MGCRGCGAPGYRIGTVKCCASCVHHEYIIGTIYDEYVDKCRQPELDFNIYCHLYKFNTTLMAKCKSHEWNY